jgi:hypothetical protein
MAEFLSPFHVRLFVLFEVVAASLEAILEALTLSVAELLWGRIPATAIMLRAVLGWAVLGCKKSGRCQGKGKRRKSESSEFHWCIPPCSPV